jgi:hypothetical protein
MMLLFIGFFGILFYSQGQTAYVDIDHTSFDTREPVGFNAAVSTFVKQTDGKIVAAGSFTNYRGVMKNYIVRLNTDGTIDTGFSIGI